jgi:dolichol-phosphate mannosyltransferase
VQQIPSEAGIDPLPSTSLAVQLFQYALASWFGIGLQYVITLWLAHSMHYMLANVIAIVIASVSNFLANDRWTFRKR